MIVVSDTSPLNGLLVIGRLDVLIQVYQKVIIPPAVYQELLALLSKTLDQGESEAIATSIERNADYLLIDEKKGRAVAESLGIKIVGLVGVLIEAKELEVIGQVKPLLDELQQKAGFWISEKFYSYILQKLGE